MKSFIRILPYLIPYWSKAVWNILLNLAGALFSVFSLAMVVPFLQVLFRPSVIPVPPPPFQLDKDVLISHFYYFIDSISFTQGKSAALMFICLFVLGMFLLKNIFQYLALYVLAPIRTGVVKDLRNDIYRRILILPLAYYSEEKRGDIIARMTSDIQEVEWSVMKSFELFFREPLTILLFMVSLFTLSWSLTLFVLILLPLSGLLIGRISKSLRRKSAKSQQKMGILMSVLEESLGGLRIIKAFNAIDRAGDTYAALNEDYTRQMVRISRRTDLASPLSEFLGIIILVIILIYGGNQVLSGHIGLSAEGFIAFIALFSQLINPVKNLTMAWYQVQKGVASLDRIHHVIDAEEVITEKPDALPITALKHSIEFRDVSFRYEEEWVLKHINLCIRKGESIALVGASGSGKSTLADLIPRFHDCTEGEILIDGINIKEYRIDHVRALMGIVTQEAILFNDSILNNIAFGHEKATLPEVEAAAKAANAHEFITAMENGYYSRIGDRGSRLSGGQRQRISIARALLNQPEVLLFDEATSALDNESEKLVNEAVEHVLKKHTSVLIAHRFSSIRHVDRIIVLDQGKIVEEGTHSELLVRNGVYKKLHDLQSLA